MTDERKPTRAQQANILIKKMMSEGKIGYGSALERQPGRRNQKSLKTAAFSGSGNPLPPRWATAQAGARAISPALNARLAAAWMERGIAGFHVNDRRLTQEQRDFVATLAAQLYGMRAL